MQTQLVSSHITLLTFSTLVLAGVVAALVIQRRRIEKNLQESEERIALATLSTKLGLWRWDARTDEIWASERLRAILGLDDSTALSRETLRASIHPDDLASFERTFEASMLSGEPYDTEFRIVTQCGDIRWIAAKFRGVRGPGNRPVRVTGALVDVSERKRAESEARQQRQQLTHLRHVALLGELSGALAHELNQPLASILSNAQAAQHFLAHDSVDLREVREILQDIVNDDKRAGNVIRTLNALLKQGDDEPQALQVPQLVAEALTLARSDLSGSKVEVVTQIDPGLGAARGDRVQLRQVLLTLLLNACRSVSGADGQNRRIDVGAAPALGRDAIEFWVADRGRTLRQEELDRLVDAYTPANCTLGVSFGICHTIVAAHGGDIWATRNEDRGVTLHFTVPVYKEGLA